MNLSALYRVAGALMVALATSCAGLQRTLSTLEVGYANGTGSTSGAFGGSVQQGGWYGAPGDLDGTYAGDSDFEAWTVSIRPLAALEPPREVVIVSMPAPPPAVPAPAPEPPRAASGCGPDPRTACAERSWHCAGCQRVVVASGGSDAHVCSPPAQPLIAVESRAPHGVTITVDGEPAVELDPFEPFKGPAPAVAVPPPQAQPAAPAQEPEKTAVPTEAWAALATLALAVAGWFTRRVVVKRRGVKNPSNAPKGSKEPA